MDSHTEIHDTARMNREVSCRSIEDLMRTYDSPDPVYCIFPKVYESTAREFVQGFPGRVLYAVKANDHPLVITSLARGGVRHFDCASLPEIEQVRRLVEDATCYFMTPVRLRGAAKAAQAEFGVRHFMVDHPSGVTQLENEIDMQHSVVFVRMAVSHEAAMIDLSNRFGAPPENVPQILSAVAETGAEPALAFNVGSSVISPAAYSQSLERAHEVMKQLPFRLRLLDIGGGFPKAYPGFDVPELEAYFETIRADMAALPLTEDGEILGEPGRALAAPGMSAISEVCLRKENRLFLNDGMYGIFWELRFRGHERFPVRAFRNGRPLKGDLSSFRLFGPTCDSSDEMPGSVEIPADVRPGDYLEFGNIGAYSLAGRTSFNGFHSDNIVVVSDGCPNGN